MNECEKSWVARREISTRKNRVSSYESKVSESDHVSDTNVNWGVVGVKFISREGVFLCGGWDAPSKRDAYGVGGVLTPNSFILFTAKAAPTFFDVGVKFISRVIFLYCAM